ncbi:MAG: phospho-sugar mutase [Clostridiales bacterium]|jgi:phosphoglucomutase|nr:phospho-sugar mutase [Clostridiales bacterium]
MDMQAIYQRWCSLATEDADLVQELKEVANDPEGIRDRFYQELEFGTGGLRGVIGAGTNRLNIYTIRRATQGLANYLLKNSDNLTAAIAYDSRIKSDVFAKEAASVLAANGITANLYPELMPTPSLSFAVRELHCAAGICVTASHNPAKYNGYKVYGADGCQITLEMADKILAAINQVDAFDDVKIMPFEEALADGKIRFITDEVVDKFLTCVQEQSINPGMTGNLKVVYTPLNGSGRRCVTSILSRIGIQDVTVVPEQEMPDGNFPTCPFPNPEIREALQKGLDLCETVHPDLLLATDPDCDRVGIAVNQNGQYQLLTGNEVGVLLLDYIAKCRIQNGAMPKDPVAVKTIVTTDMANKVAAKYSIELREVLTGFKFIGEQIGLLEQQGRRDRYIFGFEESYGYLSGGYVRDKDAVVASMLICEMALYYKNQGKTLVDALNALYQEFGFYKNQLTDCAFEGADGMKNMKRIMQSLRDNAPKAIGPYTVCGYTDYQASIRVDGDKTQPVNLPKSNVLEYRLDNGGKMIIRPSGTEPKIKIYLSAKGESMADAQAITDTLKQSAKQLLGL